MNDVRIWYAITEKNPLESLIPEDFGPSRATRTPGILLPKQARYQLRYTRMTELYYSKAKEKSPLKIVEKQQRTAKLVGERGAAVVECKAGGEKLWTQKLRKAGENERMRIIRSKENQIIHSAPKRSHSYQKMTRISQERGESVLVIDKGRSGFSGLAPWTGTFRWFDWERDDVDAYRKAIKLAAFMRIINKKTVLAIPKARERNVTVDSVSWQTMKSVFCGFAEMIGERGITTRGT